MPNDFSARGVRMHAIMIEHLTAPRTTSRTVTDDGRAAGAPDDDYEDALDQACALDDICPMCNGDGCEDCDWTGVQELDL